MVIYSVQHAGTATPSVAQQLIEKLHIQFPSTDSVEYWHMERVARDATGIAYLGRSPLYFCVKHILMRLLLGPLRVINRCSGNCTYITHSIPSHSHPDTAVSSKAL